MTQNDFLMPENISYIFSDISKVGISGVPLKSMFQRADRTVRTVHDGLNRAAHQTAADGNAGHGFAEQITSAEYPGENAHPHDLVSGKEIGGLRRFRGFGTFAPSESDEYLRDNDFNISRQAIAFSAASAPIHSL